MMWIFFTPCSSVVRQPSIFGIMPEEIVPSLISRRASVAVSEWMRLSGSLTSRSTPGMSLSTTSFSAPIAAATAVAAVSALTLSFSPLAVIAIDGITGTCPA